MKKIMFNDKYGLTQAVLKGQKTITRQIIPNCTGVRKSIFVKSSFEDLHGYELNPRYEIGEVVAIAQPYKDILDYLPEGYRRKSDGWISDFISTSSGLNNKMFVRPDLMPHHIHIANIGIERLQNISDEDCLKEGIVKQKVVSDEPTFLYAYDAFLNGDSGYFASLWFRTPKEAFAALIDKVSGKGTWESNPFVWVYDFELQD